MTSSFQQIAPQDLKEIQSLPGNEVCIDCNTRSPEWASVKFATVFCLECSGIHRSLGTHIDFVRSLLMDSWSQEQLQVMKMGGNKAFQDFLLKHGVRYDSNDETATRRDRITTAYTCPAAVLYKQVLQARLQGKPEPTKLPPKENNSSTGNKTKPARKMEGFGSSPVPPRKRPLRRTAALILAPATVVVVGVAAWYWK